MELKTGVTVTLPRAEKLNPTLRKAASLLEDFQPSQRNKLRKIQSEFHFECPKITEQQSILKCTELSLPNLNEEVQKGKRLKSSKERIDLPPIECNSYPTSMENAMIVAKKSNAVFYLEIAKPLEDLNYDPYEFRVVKERPKSCDYALLSSTGITRVMGNEVTFTTSEEFVEEARKYHDLKKIKFFRHFRVAKRLGAWRVGVRARKVSVGRQTLLANLLTTNNAAREALQDVSQLCNALSAKTLIEITRKNPSEFDGSISSWEQEVQNDLLRIQDRFSEYRTLILQILSTKLMTEEATFGSDITSNNPRASIQRGSLRSVSRSSLLSGSSTNTALLRSVKVADFMVCNCVRTILHNTMIHVLNVFEGTYQEESINDLKVFKVDVGIRQCIPKIDQETTRELSEERTSISNSRKGSMDNYSIDGDKNEIIDKPDVPLVSCATVPMVDESPDLNNIKSGVQNILGFCRDVILAAPTLMQHFTEGQSRSSRASVEDFNTILHNILESDEALLFILQRLFQSIEKLWQRVKEKTNPIQDLLSQSLNLRKSHHSSEQEELALNDEVKTSGKIVSDDENKGARTEESGSTGTNKIGEQLGSIEKLLQESHQIPESIPVGVLWLDCSNARTWLIEMLSEHKTKIHQKVVGRLESRIEELQKVATERWLGLEMAPVTAQQVVTLLTFVIEVKEQMSELLREEEAITKSFKTIQMHKVSLNPEIENKYEVLCKDLKRLRKCVRRSVMERPSAVTKLKNLLEKEIQELDRETEKLREQVEALKFLRITSDRQEALRMLESAESRAMVIRTQAVTIAEYQQSFQINVCPFEELSNVEQEIHVKTQLWRCLDEWEKQMMYWRKTEIRKLSSKKIASTTENFRATLQYLEEECDASSVLDHLRKLIVKMENKLPLLFALTAPELRPRHWEAMERVVGHQLPQTLTLGYADHLATFSYEIIHVAEEARLHYKMENLLQTVKDDINSLALQTAKTPFDEHCSMLVQVDLLHHVLIEMNLHLHTLMTSPYASHIKKESIEWKETRDLLEKTLNTWLTLQEQYLLLLPALSSRSASSMFPAEVAIFDTVKTMWNSIMEDVHSNPNAVSHIEKGVLLKKLEMGIEVIGYIEDKLSLVLNARRYTFPRLFLLPDSALIDLLFQGEDVNVMRRYIHRLFPGVSNLVKINESVTALISPEGEQLTFSQEVLARHGVEDWFERVECSMRATISRLILDHIGVPLHELLKKGDLPYQVVDMSVRLSWSKAMIQIIEGNCDYSTLDGMLPPENIDHSSQLPAKPNIMNLVNIFNKLISFVCESIRITDRSYKKIRKPLSEEEIFILERADKNINLSSDGVKRNPKLTRKIGTLYESLSLQDNDLYLLEPNSHRSTGTALNDSNELTEDYLVMQSNKLCNLATTLMELRDASKMIAECSPKTSNCWNWLRFGHHTIAGSGRIASVQYKIAGQSVSYGYEYLGIPRRCVTSYCATERALLNLVKSLSNSRVASFVSDIGVSKRDTVKTLAHHCARYLVSITCSHLVTAKDMTRIFQGSVTSGLWLFLEEPQELQEELLDDLAQNIREIDRATSDSHDYCMINRQQTKLSEKFSLFMGISTNKERCPLFNSVSSADFLVSHPIGSFMKVINVSLPPLDTILEVELISRGFNVSSNFISRCIRLLEEITSKVSPIRFIRTICQVASETRRRSFNSVASRISFSDEAIVMVAMKSTISTLKMKEFDRPDEAVDLVIPLIVVSEGPLDLSKLKLLQTPKQKESDSLKGVTRESLEMLLHNSFSKTPQENLQVALSKTLDGVTKKGLIRFAGHVLTSLLAYNTCIVVGRNSLPLKNVLHSFILNIYQDVVGVNVHSVDCASMSEEKLTIRVTKIIERQTPGCSLYIILDSPLTSVGVICRSLCSFAGEIFSDSWFGTSDLRYVNFVIHVTNPEEICAHLMNCSPILYLDEFYKNEEDDELPELKMEQIVEWDRTKFTDILNNSMANCQFDAIFHDSISKMVETLVTEEWLHNKKDKITLEDFVSKCFTVLNCEAVDTTYQTDDFPITQKDVHLPTVLETEGENNQTEIEPVESGVRKEQNEARSKNDIEETTDTDTKSEVPKKSLGNLKSLKLVRALAGLIKWIKLQKAEKTHPVKKKIEFTEEFKMMFEGLKFLLPSGKHFLFYGDFGQGMSTFWNQVEETLENVPCMIRFRCSRNSTLTEFTHTIMENLIQTSNDLAVDVRGGSKRHRTVEYPGDESVLLLLDDVHLLPDCDKRKGSLWEALRNLMQFGKFYSDLYDGDIFLKNVVVVLTVSISMNNNKISKDGNEGKDLKTIIPIRVLRLLVPVKFPSPSLRRIIKLINLHLEEFIPEINEHDGAAGKLPQVIRSLHIEIQNILTNQSFEAKEPYMSNLNHLIRLSRALGKHFQAFGLPECEAVDLIRHQTMRVYKHMFSAREEDLVKAIEKCLEQMFAADDMKRKEHCISWWPHFYHNEILLKCSNDHTHFEQQIEKLKSPCHFQLTQLHLKMVGELVEGLTDEPSANLIITGPHGSGKRSLVDIVLKYVQCRVHNLQEENLHLMKSSIKTCLEYAYDSSEQITIVARCSSLPREILDILLSLTVNGWSRKLFSNDEEKSLLKIFKKKGVIEGCDAYMDKEMKRKVKRLIIARIRKFLHICYLFNSEEEMEKLLSSSNKAVSWHCSYVSIGSDGWPESTLMNFAGKILQNVCLPEDFLVKVSKCLAEIHLTLLKNSKSLNTSTEGHISSCGEVKNTLGDFVECCKLFQYYLQRRRKQLGGKLNLLKNGLKRIEESSKSVEEMKYELSQLEPALKKAHELASSLTSDLGKQRETVDSYREEMARHQERVKEQDEVVSKHAAEVAVEVKAALSILEVSERGIKALDKKDLAEVRALNKPPELVVLSLEPICLLLGLKTEWSTMKTLLGDASMTRRLLELDKSNINEVVMRKVKKYLEHPKFTPEEIGKVSRPCRVLCVWLRALDHYTVSLHAIEPKRIRLADAERDLSSLMVGQRQLQQQLGESERQLGELESRYEGCVSSRQQLEAAIRSATGRLQRCTRLTTVLADEDVRWHQQLEDCELEAKAMFGDCILASTASAYFGLFRLDEIAIMLRSLCSGILEKHCISVQEVVNLSNTMSENKERETWLQSNLEPDDSRYVQVAMLLSSFRPILVSDPDQQLIPFLQKLYEQTGGVAVYSLGNNDLNSIIRKIMTERSKTVIVQHVNSDEKPGGNLGKLLDVIAEITKSQCCKENTVEHLGKGSSGVLKCKCEISEIRHRIIFLTHDSQPSMAEHIASRISTLSFAIKSGILEERLLDTVLLQEREDLHQQSEKLRASILKDKEAEQSVDNAILKKLIDAPTPLETEALLSAIYESKASAAEYRTKLSENSRTLQKIRNVRDKYRPVARRGRLVFSCYKLLRRVDTNYVFSLTHFLKVFSECVCGKIGQNSEEVVSFDQRISSLVALVTQFECCHVTSGLKSPHVAAFLTLLSAAVLHAEDILEPHVWHHMLSSLGQKQTLTNLSSDRRSPDLKRVSKQLLQGTKFYVQIEDFITEIKASELESSGTRSTLQKLPRRVTDFESMMLVRHCRPLLMMSAARALGKTVLGPLGSLQQPSELNTMLGESDRQMGVMVRGGALTGSRDPLREVLQEARDRERKEPIVQTIILHKQTEIEEGYRGIKRTVESAAQNGGWIVVQNACQSSLLTTLLSMMFEVSSPNYKVDSNFRLVLVETEKRSVTETVPPNLSLLCRPFNISSELTFSGILSSAFTVVDRKLYGQHYQACAWRRAVWLAASVYSVIVISTELSNTPSTSSEDGHEEVLSSHLCVEDLRTVYETMNEISLLRPIKPDTVISILDQILDKRECWESLVASKRESSQCSLADKYKDSNLISQWQLQNQSDEEEPYKKMLEEPYEKMLEEPYEEMLEEPYEEMLECSEEGFGFSGEESDEFENGEEDVEDWFIPESVGVTDSDTALQLVSKHLALEFPYLHKETLRIQNSEFLHSFSMMSEAYLKNVEDKQ